MASFQSDCSKCSRDRKVRFHWNNIRFVKVIVIRIEGSEMGDDETLIEGVRGFDCLWKVTPKAYKDLRAKENAWKAVSEKV